MRQLFKIDESEKRRILEMHENATKKNYLNEGKIAKCIKDDNTNPSVAKVIGVLGADKLCGVLGTNYAKEIGQGFFGEFYYVGVLNPESGNAANRVTISTFSSTGSMYDLCTFSILTGAKEWVGLNTDGFMQTYVTSNNQEVLSNIKSDKTTNKQKSIDFLGYIVDTSAKFDPTKFAEYLVSLVTNPPKNPAKSETIKLAVQNARTVPAGQKMLGTGILASLNSAVPQATTQTTQTPPAGTRQ